MPPPAAHGSRNRPRPMAARLKIKTSIHAAYGNNICQYESGWPFGAFPTGRRSYVMSVMKAPPNRNGSVQKAVSSPATGAMVST